MSWFLFLDCFSSDLFSPQFKGNGSMASILPFLYYSFVAGITPGPANICSLSISWIYDDLGCLFFHHMAYWHRFSKICPAFYLRGRCLYSLSCLPRFNRPGRPDQRMCKNNESKESPGWNVSVWFSSSTDQCKDHYLLLECPNRLHSPLSE